MAFKHFSSLVSQAYISPFSIYRTAMLFYNSGLTSLPLAIWILSASYRVFRAFDLFVSTKMFAAYYIFESKSFLLNLRAQLQQKSGPFYSLALDGTFDFRYAISLKESLIIRLSFPSSNLYWSSNNLIATMQF